MCVPAGKRATARSVPTTGVLRGAVAPPVWCGTLCTGCLLTASSGKGGAFVWTVESPRRTTGRMALVAFLRKAVYGWFTVSFLEDGEVSTCFRSGVSSSSLMAAVLWDRTRVAP